MGSASTLVEISTCPVTVLQHEFTISDDAEIKAHTLSRCLPGCCFIQFTSLLVHKCMDTAGSRAITIGDNHDDLVVLASSLDDELIEVFTTLERFDTLAAVVGTIVSSEELLTLDRLFKEIVLQCLTQHQRPLTDVQFNGVASVLGSHVVSEGLGHWSPVLMSIV